MIICYKCENFLRFVEPFVPELPVIGVNAETVMQVYHHSTGLYTTATLDYGYGL